MPYIRVRGRQLALVRSVRDPRTKEVSQVVLFVLYSRAEARAALGRGVPRGSERFREILREAHPDVRFNWPSIRRGIEANLEVLPEAPDEEGNVALERLRSTVQALLKELVLLDPNMGNGENQRLINAVRPEFQFAEALLRERLTMSQDNSPSPPQPFSEDPPWRFGTRTEEPTDVEEVAGELYDQGDLDGAEERFRILTDIFPRYAEGFNSLGCIALQRGDLTKARTLFEKTVEVGRKLFPARIGKSSYWSLLETRPYIRGLENLASTLNRDAKYPEAFTIAERLENECGMIERAVSLRAKVYLNTSRWKEAAEQASRLVHVMHWEAFPAGFALVEAGDPAQGIEMFIYAALNHPMTARRFGRVRVPAPRTHLESEDFELAEDLLKDLHAYFGKRAARGSAVLRILVRRPQIASLLDRIPVLHEERSKEGPKGGRAAFDELTRLQSIEFARKTAAALNKDGGT